ncbi:MAG: ribosome maturation factor RimP [Rhodanobacteraceae bacterium]
MQVIADLEHDARFAGVEFVAHAARRRSNTTAFTVTIDREGGVDLQSCERVAAAINANLDEYDDVYTLEVESAGLNRMLTKPGDYDRFAGKTVKIVTTLHIEGAKTHRGILRGVRGTNVILETAKGDLPLPLPTIKTANLEYDIRTDLTRDKHERSKHG